MTERFKRAEIERAKKLAYIIGLFLLAIVIQEFVAGRLIAESETSLSPRLVIDDSFVSRTLGDIAYFKCVSIDSAGIPQMDTHGIPIGFQVSEKKKILRPEKDQNRCFQFLEIVNNSQSTTEFVWSAEQLRIDELIWYRYENGHFIYQESFKKTNPLFGRHFPFYNYSIPIAINAGDTLIMLVQSLRYAGIFEINAKLSTEVDYFRQSQKTEYSKIIVLSVSLTIVLFMLALGYYFQLGKMISLGYYLLVVALFFFSTYGYIEGIKFPSNISLTANNLLVFFAFLANASLHPFGYQIVKKYLQSKKRYKSVSILLAGANLLFVVGFFFPNSDPRAFHQFMVYALSVLVLFNLIWIFIITALIYLRGGRIGYFLSCLILFSPYFLNENIAHLGGDSQSHIAFTNLLNPVLVVIILIFMILLLLRTELIDRDKYKRELSSQKEQLESQRSSEIKEIGRNLHDNISNALASILGYLQLKEIKREEVRDLTIKTIKDIRIISHQLIDSEFYSLSLSIQKLVAQLNDFSTTRFYFYDETGAQIDSLSKAKQNNVYRIVQELLTNILKHSQAQEAYVQIFENDSNFQIVVEDDGIGINERTNTNGIGLKNIKERAKLQNLDIQIDSSEKGTSCFIIIDKTKSINT